MRGLFFIVIFSGRSLSWLIFPTPTIICLPLFIKLMALLVRLFGGFVGYRLAKISVRFSSNSYFLVKYLYFISTIWYIPFLSTLGVNYYFLKLGSLVTKNFDQGWSEYLGGQGIYKFLGGLSKTSQLMEVNNLKIYLLIFILWLVILIIFIYLNSL
jgi:NADH-ubiquinone oxidoreductase chain 5